MTRPVAIVTGSSSGIGLALTKHLAAREWNVVTADINPPRETIPNTRFVQTDISSWQQQASMFSQAYEWYGGVDFVALNAGIDDRDDIFASISRNPSSPPAEPNMATIYVNLIGTYYGIKLAAHYLSLDSKGAGKPKAGGKIVVTASDVGITPLPVVPQYTASKHGLVGLVRSLAPGAAKVNIAINAVLPALVATNLAPAGMMNSFSQDQITPMGTIMRCFSELADIDRVDDETWVEMGHMGETVEGNLHELTWHKPPGTDSPGSYLDEQGQQAWIKAYAERNSNFAKQDWKKSKV